MVGLSYHRFNTLLKGASQDVLWLPSTLCPCTDPLSGAALPSCPTCQGRGVIWSAPIEAWCVPCGMRVQRQWQNMGKFETGDVVVSVGCDSPFWQAGESDRIQLIASSEPFNAVLTYTGSETVGFMVQSISSAFYLDPVTSAIISLGIPGVDGTGLINWSIAQGGPTPPAGVQYSLSGRRIPEFYVFQELPGDRAHYGGNMPRRIATRKFDLFGK